MAKKWTVEEEQKIKYAAQRGGISILKLVFDLRCSTRGNMYHRSAKTLIRKIKEIRRQSNGSRKN